MCLTKDPEVMAWPVFSSGRWIAPPFPCGSVISQKLVSVWRTAEAQFLTFPVVPAVTRPCFRPALQALTISRCPAGMALPGSVRPVHVAIRATCSPFWRQRVRPCSCDCPPWVEAFPVLKPHACPVPVAGVDLCLLLSHAPLCTSEHLCRPALFQLLALSGRQGAPSVFSGVGPA